MRKYSAESYQSKDLISTEDGLNQLNQNNQINFKNRVNKKHERSESCNLDDSNTSPKHLLQAKKSGTITSQLKTNEEQIEDSKHAQSKINEVNLSIRNENLQLRVHI